MVATINLWLMPIKYSATYFGGIVCWDTMSVYLPKKEQHSTEFLGFWMVLKPQTIQDQDHLDGLYKLSGLCLLTGPAIGRVGVRGKVKPG